MYSSFILKVPHLKVVVAKLCTCVGGTGKNQIPC